MSGAGDDDETRRVKIKLLTLFTFSSMIERFGGWRRRDAVRGGCNGIRGCECGDDIDGKCEWEPSESELLDSESESVEKGQTFRRKE